MNGGNCPIAAVVEQDRYAVGCGYADTRVGQLRHNGIYAFERRREVGGRDLSNLCAVYLMRKHKVAVVDVQASAEFLAASRDVCGSVASVWCYVKTVVWRLSHCAMALSAEGCY